MVDSNLLTATQLREVLHYQPETGLFTWRIKRGNKAAGSIAGCIDPEGYWTIGLNYSSHRAARLAWLYVMGSWPTAEVDHKDRNRANNAWSNLKMATHTQNAVNASDRLRNTSGYRGVVKVKRTGKWLAKVVAEGKQHYFGTHGSAEQAARAYDVGVRVLHGEFAILNFPEPTEALEQLG